MSPGKPKYLLFLIGTNHFIKHSGHSYRGYYFITRGIEFHLILVGMRILSARTNFEWIFPLGTMLLAIFPLSWGPTEALMQGFISSYGISRFSSLWSPDKVLFIVFIFWPLGFATIYYLLHETAFINYKL